MTWVLAVAAAWVGVAVLLAVVIGRGISLADRKTEAEAAAAADAPNFVVDTTSPAAVDATSPAAVEPTAETSSAVSDATTGRSRPTIPLTRPPVLGACVPPSERAPAPRRADRS